jgi:hypothetical protein
MPERGGRKFRLHAGQIYRLLPLPKDVAGTHRRADEGSGCPHSTRCPAAPAAATAAAAAGSSLLAHLKLYAGLAELAEPSAELGGGVWNKGGAERKRNLVFVGIRYSGFGTRISVERKIK